MTDAAKRWEIKRTTAEVNFFGGISAPTADEAIQKFYEGEGEIDLERTQYPKWQIEAVEVDG